MLGKHMLKLKTLGRVGKMNDNIKDLEKIYEDATKEVLNNLKKDQLVTIAIRLSTRQRLKAFGKMNDTYDSVINKLLDKAEAQAEKQKGE